MPTHLPSYYQARAAEYERVYQKPERQSELQRLKSLLPELYRRPQLLEIGCGTGYWTEVLAPKCETLTAVDISPATLEIAQSKSYPPGVMQWVEADMYELPFEPEQFTGAFAGFVWSHLPRHQLKEFLAYYHRFLQAGSQVVWVDNRYVAGSSTPISETDEHDNTYQLRSLSNGSQHMVLKNFPDEAEVQDLIGSQVTNLKWLELDYFWVLRYRV
ncbi:MAG: methyltransferase domain-containing protein [Bacteroidota bacterium]